MSKTIADGPFPMIRRIGFTLCLIAATAAMNVGRAAEPASGGHEALEAAQRIDALLVSELTAESAGANDTARRCGDEAFLRRAYFDLIGRSPTADEVTLFALDTSSDKRQKLIDRLVDDPRFGENWARYWRDVFMYRRSEDRAQIAAPALFEYLRDRFNQNAPWDEIARSFITATGDVREKGETGLVMAQNGDTANITSEVARIFLGIQIQCAQCHDHKTDRWTRAQFHELAAFFPRIAVRPNNDGDKRSFQVVGNDRPRQPRREVNRPIGQPEHYMPDLDNPAAPGTKMQPVFFLTGQRLEFGAADAERRQAIANWITSPDDGWFAKAFVNRVWAELVGFGFYEPIDDLGPDRDCTAPKTLDYLARQFVASGYDVKRLYRTIANTRVYERESRQPRKGEASMLACNCPKRLRGDQLYDALENALGELDTGSSARGRFAEARSARGQVNQAFGYDPSTPADDVVGSIPQALMLMNGPRINGAMTARRPDTELAKLLASTPDNESVTVELYLKCIGREPNKNELQKCLAYVKRSGNRGEAFEDILWALVNSTEFLHRK